MASKETHALPWIPVCDGTAALNVGRGCIVAVDGAGLCFVPAPAEAVAAEARRTIDDHNARAKAEAEAKAKAEAAAKAAAKIAKNAS